MSTIFLSSKRGDQMVFENTVKASISMRLFILSTASSLDTKTFILLLQESYFSTVINVDRAESKLMKIPFRRL
jgi:hypothetical protein